MEDSEAGAWGPRVELTSYICAYTIAQVGVLIASLDATRTIFEQRLNTMTNFMASSRLPLQFHRRAQAYLTHEYESQQGEQTTNFLAELNPSLRGEIMNSVSQKMIKEVLIFRDIGAAPLAALTEHLSLQAFPAGE